MGSKLSCIHRSSLSRQQPTSPAPARVIAADGSLKEFAASPRVTVSDVLGGGVAGGAQAPFFLCNSDALYFNEHPPALAPGEPLPPGQIYFVLPAAMLGRPLSSAEMGALAAKASAALEARARPRRARRVGRKKKVRVTPVGEETSEEGVDAAFNKKLNEHTLGEFAVSLIPARSSKKPTPAAAARSPLRRALSTIKETAE